MVLPQRSPLEKMSDPVEMIEAFEISQKRATLATRYRVGSQVPRKYKLPHSKQQDAGPAAAA
jgi:hypothetical protein